MFVPKRNFNNNNNNNYLGKDNLEKVMCQQTVDYLSLFPDHGQPRDPTCALKTNNISSRSNSFSMSTVL